MEGFRRDSHIYLLLKNSKLLPNSYIVLIAFQIINKISMLHAITRYFISTYLLAM